MALGGTNLILWMKILFDITPNRVLYQIMSLFLNKYEVSIVQGHFPDIFKKTRKPAGPVFRFSGFQKNLKTRGFRTLRAINDRF